MESTLRSRSQIAAEAYRVTRNQLIEWGVIMASIYLTYVVIFPLLPSINIPGEMLDMEMMISDEKKWLILYILGLGGLFYSYWRMFCIVRDFPKEYVNEEKSLRIWVVAIGVACGGILLGLYPITAIDVALYVVRSRLWALYGGNPMTALPANFPQDPYIAIAGEFSKEPSPYGPLWELTAQIPMQIGFLEIASGIVSMKIISLVAYIGTAALIGWHAQTDKARYYISGATTAAFFALNPLVLLEAIGNGHNDMLMLFFITLGLIIWQKGQWAWATFALTLAVLTKVTGLILLPLFGVTVLIGAAGWRTCMTRGLGMLAISLITFTILYCIMGLFPDVFTGAKMALFDRRGYSPAYAALVLSWKFFPNQSYLVFPAFSDLYIAYYLYLLFALAEKKITLIEAGFMAYFSQLMLGAVFRIWYPIWLIPFAALGLNSRFYWRTFLFSITAELSILSYFFLWRWNLSTSEWGLHGPLSQYWDYWRVMTLFTVPWTFGVPFLGDLLRRKDRERFDNSLWV